MKRHLALAYGVFCYAVFFATFLYLAGFLAGVGVPKDINSGGAGFSPVVAAMVNLGLLLLFGLQHSIMARPGFKAVWTRVVPSAMERSTYVLIASLCLILLYWAWQPITAIVWHAETPLGVALGWGVFALGLGLVLVSTFLIDHFDLFGLKQVWHNLRGRISAPPAFQVRFLYKYLRHPIYLGWMLAFWGTPTMTAGHLLFATVMSTYMLVAIRFEERDLIAIHGENYRRYRERVPMLVPDPRRIHPPVRPAEDGQAAGPA
jgi:methanethiol S-methyltransferase